MWCRANQSLASRAKSAGETTFLPVFPRCVSSAAWTWWVAAAGVWVSIRVSVYHEVNSWALLFRQRTSTKSSPWFSSPDRLPDSDCNSELLLTLVEASRSLSSAAASGICLQVEVSNSSDCLQLWHLWDLYSSAPKLPKAESTETNGVTVVWCGRSDTWPLPHVIFPTKLNYIMTYKGISHVGLEEMHFIFNGPCRKTLGVYLFLSYLIKCWFLPPYEFYSNVILPALPAKTVPLPWQKFLRYFNFTVFTIDFLLSSSIFDISVKSYSQFKPQSGHGKELIKVIFIKFILLCCPRP